MLSKLQRLANRARVDDSDGFTLIELLIVVVIIGILAAIAIPQFSSTKEKAYDAAAKSDLRNLMTAQEGHFANYGQYATTFATSETGENSSTIYFNASQNITPGGSEDGLNLTSSNPSLGYIAESKHPSSSNQFCIEVGDPQDDGTGGGGEVSNDDSYGDGTC